MSGPERTQYIFQAITEFATAPAFQGRYLKTIQKTFNKVARNMQKALTKAPYTLTADGLQIPLEDAQGMMQEAESAAQKASKASAEQPHVPSTARQDAPSASGAEVKAEIAVKEKAAVVEPAQFTWQTCNDLDAESKTLLERVCKEAMERDAGTVAKDVTYSEAIQKQLQEPVKIHRKTITGKECKPEIITRKEYLERLARDPDHNFKISQNTLDEASAILALERRGLLKGPLVRKAGTDFVDIMGIEWNIKKAISKIPANPKHIFNAEEFLDKIRSTFSRGENIIIDARNLEKIDMMILKNKILQSFNAADILRIIILSN